MMNIVRAIFVVLTGFVLFGPQGEPKETRASSTVLVSLPQGHGSGVYLGNGYVLTVDHVAGRGKDLKVKTDKGDDYDATLLWSNHAYDVALLQITEKPNSIVPARLACRTPKTGEEITAAGNPLSISFINTYGRVSGPPREFNDTKWVTPASYTVIPGMSGGPVYDAKGFVLGLNDMVTIQPMGFTAAPVGLGWFVPAKVACLLMMRG